MKRVRSLSLSLPLAFLTVGLVGLMLTFHPRPAEGQSTTTVASPPPAPTGFDNQTNGLVNQQTFLGDKAVFSAVGEIQAGIGPVFNSDSCKQCHESPVTGAASQVREVRAGFFNSSAGTFTAPTVVINDGVTVNNVSPTIGPRTLINSRATCPAFDNDPNDTGTDSNGNPNVFNFPGTSAIELFQNAQSPGINVMSFRLSLNALGDGFVEALADDAIIANHNNQCNHVDSNAVSSVTGQVENEGSICGEYLEQTVAQDGETAVGRLGWKDQHADLLTFAGDALLNEMGITNRLNPNENTVYCNPSFVSEPNDPGGNPALGQFANIDHFTEFMRSTKAPPRDQLLLDNQGSNVAQGQAIFDAIGCNSCHVDTYVTQPAGTVTAIFNSQTGFPNGISAALGGLTIHPYSDFLLHDVGTGDGIQQEGEPADTLNKVRTPPLWGLRTREVLMHDGLSFTMMDAIRRHQGEASQVIQNLRNLSSGQRRQVLLFLNSL
jgi:CxxC motif-containing protein (DUF1111 family)